jgi:choline dehydrogenase-like flavoprotein
MRVILDAADGQDVWGVNRTVHLMGTCRMGSDPRISVVNADCRSHDIPKRFICDGSVFSNVRGREPVIDHPSDR